MYYLHNAVGDASLLTIKFIFMSFEMGWLKMMKSKGASSGNHDHAALLYSRRCSSRQQGSAKLRGQAEYWPRTNPIIFLLTQY
jgi:hypothetical protein